MADDLRIGIIGVGVMGADHAERVARKTAGARLVAVSDPDTARAGRLAETLGVRTVDDPLALIADDEVDAVLIASPGFAHAEQLFACLEHRKPVLCEKPLTLDVESALRVVEAEQKLGQQLIQVGFMRRFDPEYVALKTLLDSGELGRMLLLHNVHRNKAVPDTFRSEMIVRDSMVHEVDVARWLFGEEIKRITVYSPRPTSLGLDGVVDPQLGVFEMASGAIADVEVFANCKVGYEVRCEAVAEQGNATVGLGVDVLTRTAGRWGGIVPDDFRYRFGTAYDLEIQHWVNATQEGRVDGPTAWDGYAAVAVCEAGVESLRSGKPVDVELADVT